MIPVDAFLIDKKGYVSPLRELHIQEMYFREVPIPVDAFDEFRNCSVGSIGAIHWEKKFQYIIHAGPVCATMKFYPHYLPDRQYVPFLRESLLPATCRKRSPL